MFKNVGLKQGRFVPRSIARNTILLFQLSFIPITKVFIHTFDLLYFALFPLLFWVKTQQLTLISNIINLLLVVGKGNNNGL